MDDVKLLTLTSLVAHKGRILGKDTRLQAPVKRHVVSVRARERPEEDDDPRAQSLSLQSISKGGLPSFDAKTKSKFYQLMRLASLDKADKMLPGSPKKRASAAVPQTQTQPQAAATVALRSRHGLRPGGNNRGESAADAAVGKAALTRPATVHPHASVRPRGGSSSAARRPITAAAAAAAAAAGASTSASSSALAADTRRETLDTSVGPAAPGPDPDPSATFSRLHRALQSQSEASHRDEALSRLRLYQSADSIISRLPLAYLYSKPELRHYAVERAVAAFYKLSLAKAAQQCARALAVWRSPPALVMSEKQVGFMVISKRLERLLLKALRIKFAHWSACYSSKHAMQRDLFRVAMATEIQRWYRTLCVTRREPFKRLMVAVRLCIDRRKAIQFAVQFEKERRAAGAKVLRTVCLRRRRHYAARAITRVRRWVKSYRKTSWRLTRLANARRLQRWWRMVQLRPSHDMDVIRFVVRLGGSRFRPRIPLGTKHDFLADGSLIAAVHKLASVLQKAWLTSKGQLAAFHEYAAKRAKEEYDRMLNENATVIQQNFRGHLWNLLTSVAVIHNRARRVQRGYRAYQYRGWGLERLRYRRERYARTIQAAFRRYRTRAILRWRFRARKAVLIFTRAKRSLSASIVQRCFRDYKERERIRKEQLRAMIASMRSKADLVVKCVSKIQRNWRQLKNKGKFFPKHVRLIIEGHVRKRRIRLHLAALTIQKLAKVFLPRQRKKRKRLLRRMANVLWRFAKSYLLKLAVFDRVEAVRRSQRLAANVMKRNFRLVQFRRKIEARGRLRGVQRAYRVFVNRAATYIQRWLRRKYAEYYVIPVRKAARLNLAKKREAELARRQAARLAKAAAFLVRFFRQFPPWRRFLRRLDPERLYYRRRIAAKKMQRFARRVVAWARFTRVVAYKRKAIALQILDAHYGAAVNVIGWYYKRYRERQALQSRFVLRARMLSEYKRLDELKLIAYEAKRVAEEDKRRTDENMAATIRASWKQGSNEQGKNYFYNFVTGETSWEAPENWQGPVNDMWMRQTDDKGNVYYFNMKSGESQWLPPCTICGDRADRYCADCVVAYCEKDYELYHTGAEAEDESWAEHKWSLTEYAMDILAPGQVYCIECKKRCADVVCTTCWDDYCKTCFNFTHRNGALKYHKTQSYARARKGWTVVKGKLAGESDFYVNGSTGETTYEKPEELMTAEELIFYTNFKSHEAAALEHVERIKQLQFDVEAIAYERDTIVARALEAGTPIGDILSKRKKKANRFQQEGEIRNVVDEVRKVTKPGYRLFSSSFAEYRQSLLQPKPRVRGGEKAAFIGSLITSVQTDLAQAATAGAAKVSALPQKKLDNAYKI